MGLCALVVQRMKVLKLGPHKPLERIMMTSVSCSLAAFKKIVLAIAVLICVALVAGCANHSGSQPGDGSAAPTGLTTTEVLIPANQALHLKCPRGAQPACNTTRVCDARGCSTETICWCLVN